MVRKIIIYLLLSIVIQKAIVHLKKDSDLAYHGGVIYGKNVIIYSDVSQNRIPCDAEGSEGGQYTQ